MDKTVLIHASTNGSIVLAKEIEPGVVKICKPPFTAIDGIMAIIS